jgi:multiple sugar transport system permease protein/raffinose/stachyose/melibiose transport system permease protein
MRRVPLALFVLFYTIVTGGPLLWVASMSLRTTAEIFKNPYGFPWPAHWSKFADAWTKSNYPHLLLEQSHRRRHRRHRRHHRRRNGRALPCPLQLPRQRLVRFLILSGLILPPQLLILALFQILLEVNLYNTLAGLILVYVATHVA